MRKMETNNRQEKYEAKQQDDKLKPNHINNHITLKDVNTLNKTAEVIT